MFHRTFAPFHREPHAPFKRREFRRHLVEGCLGPSLGRKDESLCAVSPFDGHVLQPDDARKLEMLIRLSANNSEPSRPRCCWHLCCC